MIAVQILLACMARAPLRGFIIACERDVNNVAVLERQLSNDHGMALQMHYELCNDADHHVSVHLSHISVLEKCETRGITPCVILEADAMWSGVLSTSIWAATDGITADGEDWDVLTMGINPEGLQRKISDGSVTTMGVRTDTTQLSGTSGGCHAYVANHPDRLAATMRERPVRLNGHARPCIERLSGPRIFLAHHMPVLQREKSGREGMPWYIDARGTITVLHCSLFNLAWNVYTSWVWNFCAYN